MTLVAALCAVFGSQALAASSSVKIDDDYSSAGARADGRRSRRGRR